MQKSSLCARDDETPTCMCTVRAGNERIKGKKKAARGKDRDKRQKETLVGLRKGKRENGSEISDSVSQLNGTGATWERRESQDLSEI